MKAYRCEWVLLHNEKIFCREVYDGRELYKAYKRASYDVSFNSGACQNIIAPFDVVRGSDPVDTYPY